MFFIKIRKKGIKKPRIDKEYIKNKEKSRDLITKRTEFFAEKYGFKYNRLAIKNTKTRWGSCSVKKNLNFNYRLIFLDEELMDYVIVHELCHLRHLNHSKEFWLEVGKILPDYKNSLKKLKRINLRNVKIYLF